MEEVDNYVEKNSIGAYIFLSQNEEVYYVGRSDEDLNGRIKKSAKEGRGYKYFYFKYESSPMRAYHLECKWYHKYEPPDNEIHPRVPNGTIWRCPVSGCEWGK
jgi:excinuclease UvrABC nuclease subunit